MKEKLFTKTNSLTMGFLALALVFISSCSEDDGGTVLDPVAQFSFVAAGSEITFTNVSENASGYSWDFGDGSTSEDANPVHAYDGAGEYEVTLIAMNGDKENMITKMVQTQNSGALASQIVGKEWIAARGNTYAYALGGAADAGTAWNQQSPPWWNFGDGDGHSYLRDRPSLINDVYVFAITGEIDVDFNGDFWAEYGLWTDTDFNETNMEIGSGLPANAAGTDMSAFANPDGLWTFEIDEEAATITCSGSGAHILSPRIAYGGDGGSDIRVPVDKVWYDIVKVVTVDGAADTLVLYAAANDGANDVGQYLTLHAYENEADIPEPTPAPCQISRSGSVAAADFSHDFLSADGASAMASLNADYVATYGAEIGGETCTKFEILNPEGHNVYGNLFLRGGSMGECEDGSEAYVDAITFDNDEYVVKFDVYIPSADNDFSGDLVNSLVVRMVDESQYAQFWEQYILIEKTDLATDQWLSLEYDFNDTDLASRITDGTQVPDAIHIDWGGDNHSAAGTFYLKHLRLEAAQ